MAKSLRPWLLDYLVGLADSHPTNVPSIPSTSPKKVQLTSFIRYANPEVESKALVWAWVSDGQTKIRVRIAKDCTDEYFRMQNRRIVSLKSAIGTLSKFSLAFLPVPQPGQTSNTPESHLFLNAESFKPIGSFGDEPYGHSKDVENEARIDEWRTALVTGVSTRYRVGQQYGSPTPPTTPRQSMVDASTTCSNDPSHISNPDELKRLYCSGILDDHFLDFDHRSRSVSPSTDEPPTKKRKLNSVPDALDLGLVSDPESYYSPTRFSSDYGENSSPEPDLQNQDCTSNEKEGITSPFTLLKQRKASVSPSICDRGSSVPISSWSPTPSPKVKNITSIVSPDPKESLSNRSPALGGENSAERQQQPPTMSRPAPLPPQVFFSGQSKGTALVGCVSSFMTTEGDLGHQRPSTSISPLNPIMVSPSLQHNKQRNASVDWHQLTLSKPTNDLEDEALEQPVSPLASCSKRDSVRHSGLIPPTRLTFGELQHLDSSLSNLTTMSCSSPVKHLAQKQPSKLPPNLDRGCRYPASQIPPHLPAPGVNLPHKLHSQSLDNIGQLDSSQLKENQPQGIRRSQSDTHNERTSRLRRVSRPRIRGQGPSTDKILVPSSSQEQSQNRMSILGDTSHITESLRADFSAPLTTGDPEGEADRDSLFSASHPTRSWKI
ncbi:hypothetical protein DL96DRAFT_1602634 [Flagelloscypha sp. PMI_526]|nr:hypothetical protein DL96DRAFT_1602634 [Flagelloscypha sp. PMI_526]